MNLHTRSSRYYEIVVGRKASYSELARQASSGTNLPSQRGNLALFKVGGAVISHDNIPYGKGSRPWTIGNYLQLLVKKSPSGVKIGVGYIASSSPKVQR